MLTELVSEATAQNGLFDTLDRRGRRRRLMSTIDNANERFGSGAVFFAAQGIKQQWKMQRSMLSPNYTTQWHEIMHVHAK